MGVEQRVPERGLAVVVLPEFVPARWWQDLLHNQTARLIKNTLIYRRGQGSRDHRRALPPAALIYDDEEVWPITESIEDEICT